MIPSVPVLGAIASLISASPSEVPPATQPTPSEAQQPSRANAPPDPERPPKTPEPARAPPTQPRPLRLYFTDCPTCVAGSSFADPGQLDAFARMLKTDPELAADAKPLFRRTNVGGWVALGGLSAGAGTAVYGLTHSSQHCAFGPTGAQSCDSSLNVSMLVAAGGIAIAGLAGGYLYSMFDRPTQAEVVEPLNRWNSRHPDRPFHLDPSHGTLLPDGEAPESKPLETPDDPAGAPVDGHGHGAQ